MKPWIAPFAIGAALLLSGTAPGTPDRSADQALIVASLDYDERVAVPLVGSYNDAALAAQTLLDRGLPRSAITVLTEQPSRALLEARGNPVLRAMPELGTPIARSTRAAILSGFARLERNARPGSRVVIMLEGHGLQIDDAGKDESDRLDGVFLPVDIGPAQAGRRPANSITDDEIARAVEAIRRKGATVMLLFAFDHSGDAIDDLNFGSGDAAVAGMASAPAGEQTKQYLVPHRTYGAPQAAGSPMIVYLMLELGKRSGPTSIAQLSRDIAPWMARHRVPLDIPFGRTDLAGL